MIKANGCDDAFAPSVGGNKNLLMVRTTSSAYLVDIGNGWVVRQPGSHASALRKDAEILKLVEMVTPVYLGKPMRMVLSGLSEMGALTVRCTTPVIGITVVETLPKLHHE